MTEPIKAKAAGVSRPIAWCAECDGKIYDYDIHIQLVGVSYCGVCGHDRANKAAEEVHLEEQREAELEGSQFGMGA